MIQGGTTTWPPADFTGVYFQIERRRRAFQKEAGTCGIPKLARGTTNFPNQDDDIDFPNWQVSAGEEIANGEGVVIAQARAYCNPNRASIGTASNSSPLSN